MILGLLIGNSRLRYGVLDLARPGVVRPGALEWKDLGDADSGASPIGVEPGMRFVVASSVRDDLLQRVEPFLPAELVPVRVARRDFPLPIENLYEKPEEAGTDRLLACVAARARAGSSGAVVVDFGTAVTISVVSPEGAFLGGLIAAGSGAVARGIELNTPRLADAARLLGSAADSTEAASGRSLPRTTSEAVRRGVLVEVGGGVRTMLEEVLRAIPFHPRVLATGGEADRLRAWVPEIEEVVPDLVFEGLAISWREARVAGDEQS